MSKYDLEKCSSCDANVDYHTVFPLRGKWICQVCKTKHFETIREKKFKPVVREELSPADEDVLEIIKSHMKEKEVNIEVEINWDLTDAVKQVARRRALQNGWEWNHNAFCSEAWILTRLRTWGRAKWFVKVSGANFTYEMLLTEGKRIIEEKYMEYK